MGPCTHKKHRLMEKVSKWAFCRCVTHKIMREPCVVCRKIACSSVKLCVRITNYFLRIHRLLGEQIVNVLL